nr:hypothetical protein [Tanacetum cinerariifolium]
MVLIEKDLKKKGKLNVEDSKITKNNSRKKVKIVVTKDQNEELIDEEEREDLNSKNFRDSVDGKFDFNLKDGGVAKENKDIHHYLKHNQMKMIPKVWFDEITVQDKVDKITRKSKEIQCDKGNINKDLGFTFLSTFIEEIKYLIPGFEKDHTNNKRKKLDGGSAKDYKDVNTHGGNYGNGNDYEKNTDIWVDNGKSVVPFNDLYFLNSESSLLPTQSDENDTQSVDTQFDDNKLQDEVGKKPSKSKETQCHKGNTNKHLGFNFLSTGLEEIEYLIHGFEKDDTNKKRKKLSTFEVICMINKQLENVDAKPRNNDIELVNDLTQILSPQFDISVMHIGFPAYEQPDVARNDDGQTTEHLIESGADLIRRRRVLESNINAILAQSPCKSLHNIDLVFFPMITTTRSHHFYLMCFNKKNYEINIIDNLNNDVDDIGQRHGNLPIYLRHMETYVGGGIFLNELKNEGQGNKDGAVNERIIPFLTNTDDVLQMDWCSYALEYMIRGCKEYKHGKYFSGPLLLMAKTVPAFMSWNSNLMLKREQKEIELGGFGRLPIVEEDVDAIEDVLDKNEYFKSLNFEDNNGNVEGEEINGDKNGTECDTDLEELEGNKDECEEDKGNEEQQETDRKSNEDESQNEAEHKESDNIDNIGNLSLSAGQNTTINAPVESTLDATLESIDNVVDVLPHICFFSCKKDSNHHYIICFDIKNAKIDIIDNINNDVEDISVRCGAYAIAPADLNSPMPVARCSVDELIKFSGETEPSRYMNFFKLQQISEGLYFLERMDNKRVESEKLSLLTEMIVIVEEDIATKEPHVSSG